MKAIIITNLECKEKENEQLFQTKISHLTEYINKNKFEVIHIIQIKKTSKEFEKAIELISNSKECIAVVTDSIDHIRSGLKESVLMEILLREGKMELHFLNDHLILNRHSSSIDIFYHAVGY